MKKSNYKNESGQTLIIAVLAIIILLIAGLFLFDLQTIIRVKIKSQTAADAAALAGARMQVESLNLIGEINIIKACTVLISDFSEGDTPLQLMAASDNLTEMQSRISFVGPLLAVGAAQQAAKNNGMVDPAEVFESPSYSEFSLQSYIENVEDDAVYGSEDYNQVIEGYEWRQAYIDMLTVINNQGLAAGPSAVTSNVNSDFSLSLIQAILSEYWCHSELRTLIKDDANFDGQWWQGLTTDVGFVEESEILSLFIRYTGNNPSGGTYNSAVDDAYDYINDLIDDRSLTLGDPLLQLPFMKWSLYDSRWTDGPGEGWVSSSQRLYLRRGLRPEYQYGGAGTKMTCLIPGGEDSKFQWLAGSYNIHNLKRKEGVISQDSADTPTVRSSSVAKPLGYLESDSDKYLPTDATMILPVFRSVRLIPVAMMPLTSIYDEDFLFYKFMKWLSGVGDIDNPATSPPAGTESYLLAFQRLNDPLWRHKGYNPSFHYTPPDVVPYYDSSTDTGAGVLQGPVPQPGSEDDPNDGYARDGDGNITGIAYTYEDRCNWYPPGGTGGGGGGGPGQLH